MEPTISAPATSSPPVGCPAHQPEPAPPAGCPAHQRPPAARSAGDLRMRRLLLIPDDAARGSLVGAQNAFTRSVWISAARCLFTYLLLPILGPVLGLSGSVGPSLGLAVGTVSVVAIVASMRRFFRADHKWRWRYTAIGGAILVLLVAQAVIDIADLAG